MKKFKVRISITEARSVDYIIEAGSKEEIEDLDQSEIRNAALASQVASRNEFEWEVEKIEEYQSSKK